MRAVIGAQTASLVAATALVAAGCGDRPSPDAAVGAEQDAVTGTVTVLAAASLTESFEEIADLVEADHPDLDVVLTFGPSSGLSRQVLDGVPADVFAAANMATMDAVVESGDAVDPEVFVTNTLQIAVPRANPGDVTGLVDLSTAADPDRIVALCAEQVPCGAAALQVFEAAGLDPAPDTLEQDVKAALTKVELGEVDAALVYRTDVTAAGGAAAGVEGIDVPEAADVVNEYPMAVLAASPNPRGAAAWVEAVRSQQGRDVLTEAGFGTP